MFADLSDLGKNHWILLIAVGVAVTGKHTQLGDSDDSDSSGQEEY
jgi:hypothetical protein